MTISNFKKVLSNLEAIIVAFDRGLGSSITIDLKESLNGVEQIDFRLWVYLTDWKIVQGGEILLFADDENDANFDVIRSKFLGVKISKFSFRDHHMKFEFEEGLVLKLFPDLNLFQTTDDMFMFFDEKKNVVFSYSIANGITESPIN